MSNKSVRINKSVYAMATTDGESAELTMYGDIMEQRPVDYWTGTPKEGNYILLDEFLDDLRSIEKCKAITIRMNSYGGDAGVSLTIHNRLREISRAGTKLTCIIDGVAMSGGSLIMCACDTVQANPGSLIMIHKAWSFLFGCYNADEMRQMSEQNNAWDKAQCEIYQRKTGLSNTVIMHMMSETTHMTGREAKEKGFVDELLDAEPTSIAASADGMTLFVHGREMHLSPGMFAPDFIPTLTGEAPASPDANIETPEVTGSKEEKSMTINELREKYPEQIAQVEAEARAAVDTTEAVSAAVKAERERMKAIDEVADQFDDELVNKAKYGENPMSAADMALEAAKVAASRGRKFMADMKADADESGAKDIGSAPAFGGTIGTLAETASPEERMAAAKAAVKELFK